MIPPEASNSRYSTSENATIVLLVALVVIVMAVYWQTFARVVDMWSRWDYQYGWLVYPTCLYLLFSKRADLAKTHLQASALGFILVALLVVGWLVARAAAIQVAEFIFATMLIFAVSWALTGTAVVRVAAFPLLLFLAAVPMGGFLVEPLMRVTANIADGLLALIGVPVLRENQFFVLSGGSFEVADVCSGLRYLLSGTLLSLAFVYTAYSSFLKRLLFVAAAAGVLVVANGVRAFLVMAVASATDMRVLGGADHVWFGTILFLVIFMALIWVGDRFADSPVENVAIQYRPSTRQSPVVAGAIVVATALVLLGGPVFGSAMMHREAAVIAEAPIPGPAGCQRVGEGQPADELPVFQGADAEWLELFACNGYDLSVYAASYGIQQQGKELIAWRNSVWPNRWRRFTDKSIAVVSVDESEVTLNEVLVRHPDGWRLTWYWYQVGTSSTHRQVRVKSLETMRVLTLKSFESSVVVVSAISAGTENYDELRRELDDRIGPLFRWNKDRAALGASQ